MPLVRRPRPNADRTGGSARFPRPCRGNARTVRENCRRHRRRPPLRVPRQSVARWVDSLSRSGFYTRFTQLVYGLWLNERQIMKLLASFRGPRSTTQVGLSLGISDECVSRAGVGRVAPVPIVAWQTCAWTSHAPEEKVAFRAVSRKVRAGGTTARFQKM